MVWAIFARNYVIPCADIHSRNFRFLCQILEGVAPTSSMAQQKIRRLDPPSGGSGPFGGPEVGLIGPDNPDHDAHVFFFESVVAYAAGSPCCAQDANPGGDDADHRTNRPECNCKLLFEFFE